MLVMFVACPVKISWPVLQVGGDGDRLASLRELPGKRRQDEEGSHMEQLSRDILRDIGLVNSSRQFAVCDRGVMSQSDVLVNF